MVNNLGNIKNQVNDYKFEKNSRMGGVSHQIKNKIAGDPYKLSRYSKNGNVKTQRNLYILMVVVPTLLIVSFIFYMIANLDGKMFGTPDDEIDNVINEKMAEFVDSVSNLT